MGNELTIEKIKDLFIIRNDTFAEQSPKSSYARIEQELTDADLTAHLDGKKTIGVYQLSPESRVKWVCYDFDGDKLEEQEQHAKNLCMKLRHTDKVEAILMEFSGKKGYHVWVFIEEADAASAKYWAEEVAEGYHQHEIFPKQGKLSDGKFGNLVKLPLGIHQVSGLRSVLFNEEYKQLDLEESIAYLETIAGKAKTKVPKVIVKEIVRTIIKPQGKTEMPSYIRQLVADGSSEGNRHKTVFIITKELYNAGYTKDEIRENVLLFNQNSSPPKPDYLIENHVNYLLQFPDRYLTKENITEIPAEDLISIESVDYDKVIETYNKWFCLKDTFAIDIALATAITRNAKTVPLWIIMIAPSGAGKSELIRPLEDKKNPSTTEVMSKITPNTFLSGRKGEYVDFAQTLENTPKLFLTYDFAQFAKLDAKDKAQVWAQLRDIYDGFIERKAGLGVFKKVDGLRVNWIICTTPIMDSELLVQQELGTRELIFRFEHEEINEEQLMNKVWDNSELVDEMRKELAFFVRSFIEKKESAGIKENSISDKTKKELMLIAKTISVLRAATESDTFSGELTNFVYKEMPTRILLQLKSLFIGLKNLDEKYSDGRALKAIQKVALSSIHPVRLRIIIELLHEGAVSTTKIQKSLSIGYKTVVTQLYTAQQLGLVKYSETEEDDSFEGVQRSWKKKVWTTTDHEVVEYLKNVKELKTEWVTLFEKKHH